MNKLAYFINPFSIIGETYVRAEHECPMTATRIGKLEPKNETAREMFRRIPNEIYDTMHNGLAVSKDTHQYYTDNINAYLLIPRFGSSYQIDTREVRIPP